jgi:hypothetical protein
MQKGGWHTAVTEPAALGLDVPPWNLKCTARVAATDRLTTSANGFEHKPTFAAG